MADIEVGNLNVKVSMDDSGINKSMAELNRAMRVVRSEFQAASAKLGGFGNNLDGLRLRADSLTKQIEIQRQRVAKLAEEHAEAAVEKGKDARETQNLEVRLNKAQAELAKMEAELKRVNAEIQKQSSNWYKMGQSLEDVGARLKNVGDRMSDAGRSLSMTLTAPLVAVGGLASKAAIDFESAFAGVRKTVDATEQEFKVFEQGIRDMAKEIPASAVEIAKVAEAAGQLGIQKNAILGFTRTMIDLGVSTNLSSDQAATALARLANITQMNQQEFDRLGSALVELGNNLATTEAEIVEMGLRIAGAGAQIGLTEAQILGFAAALSSVGIAAEAGGTAISRVFITISNAVQEGSQELSLFAQVAGMSVAEFSRLFREDAAMATVAFIEGLDRLAKSGGNVFAVLKELGLSEIRVRDALLRAASAGDLFRNSIELASRAWEENTALTKEAEQRYQTTESQLQILKNRITDIGIELGGPLLNALNQAIQRLDPFINAIARAATWFANLDPGIQSLIISFAGLLAVLGPGLVVFGQLAGAFGTLIKTFGTVSKSIAEAGGMMTVLKTAFSALTSPIGLTVLAIGAVAAVAYLIIKNWEPIKEFFSNLWNGIKETTQTAWSGIVGFFSGAWESISTTTQNVWNGIVSFLESVWNGITAAATSAWEGLKSAAQTIWQGIVAVVMAIVTPFINGVLNIFNNMKSGLTSIWEGIKQYFSGVWEVIKNIFLGAVLLIVDLVTGDFEGLKNDAKVIFENLKNALNNIWEGIKKIFSGALDAVVGFAKGAWENIKGNTMAVWNTVKEFLSIIWNIILSLGKSAWENLKTAVSNLVTATANTIHNIWNGILDFFRNLPGTLYNLAVNMFSRMREAVSEWMSKVKQTVIDLMNEALNFLRTLPETLFNIGRGIIQGLLDGISSMAKAVFDKAREIADRVKETIRGALRIHSPSKVMMELGEWTGEGFAVGLQRSMASIMRQAEAIAEVATAASSRPAVAAASAGPSQTPVINIYMEGLLAGANFGPIRNDTDREQLAREIARNVWHMAMQAARGQGGVWR